jgi:cytosine/uracil/thiamine/allantoin permease
MSDVSVADPFADDHGLSSSPIWNADFAPTSPDRRTWSTYVLYTYAWVVTFAAARALYLLLTPSRQKAVA